MKVVILSRSKKRTKIFHHFRDAFHELGHKASLKKYHRLESLCGEKIATAVYKVFLTAVKPDLMFIQSPLISPALIKWANKRMITILYSEDCLVHRDEKIWGRVKEIGRHATAMYMTPRGEVPLYRSHGINAKFITGGCNPAVHYVEPQPEAFYQSDVAFIGKPSTPERVEWLKTIKNRFDLKLWGPGWKKVGMQSEREEVFAPEYRKICAGAKIILGWNVDPTIDLYFSNRTWYTLGCGGFLLTAYSPNLEELFGRGVELDWFETVDECCKKIEHYLYHDEKRKEVANAGYKLAHSRYRYTDIVKKMINEVYL